MKAATTTTTIEALKVSSATWVEALAALHEELASTEETAARASTTSSTMDCDDDADGISTEIRGLLRRLQQLETTVAHLHRAATEVAEQRESAVEMTHQQLLVNQELMQQLLEGLTMENGLSLDEQREQEILHEKLKSMYRPSSLEKP